MRKRERLPETHQLIASMLKEDRQIAEFKKAVIEDGSETEENLDAAARIQYGVYRIDDSSSEPRVRAETAGLFVGEIDCPVSLSDLSCALEDLDDIPLELARILPDLGREDWHAAMRIISLLLISLERRELIRGQ